MLLKLKGTVKLLLRYGKKRKKGPVRVVFLCQYIPAWIKVAPLYRKMCEDARFEPILLCVPSEDKLSKPLAGENDTYAYFRDQGFDEAVNAVTEAGGWFDLQSLSPDFVFYPRPYDTVLPAEYTGGRVCRYARICLLMYGMSMTKQITKISLEPVFFRHVYFYFAETDYVRRLNRRNFPFSHFFRIRRTENYGMPSLSLILEEKESSAPAWDFAPQGAYRFMWTPRWTTDPNLGGTNFFLYKDWLLDYAENHGDTAWLFRPHPLAFDNFVRAGEMTQDQVDAYRSRIENAPNVTLDREKEYVTSFWQSDALITDISGIMPEYFLMDKPMVFCRSNMILDPTDFTARMLEGCYCVDGPEQLRQVLDGLRQGNDPLKQKRAAIIEELFGDSLNESIPRIINELAESL